MRRGWLSAIGVLVVAGLVGLVVARCSSGGGTSPASACGLPVQYEQTSPWRCTFDDEFDGSHLDTAKWVPATTFVSGSVTGAHSCYSPRNVAVSGGALHLSLTRVATPLTCLQGLAPTHYSAGMVSTFHRFSQAYGRFEARFRVTPTSAAGLNEDFWLWPDARVSPIHWPSSGEMDVAQLFSNNPLRDVPYLHYTANDNGGPIVGLNTAACVARRGVWNTYDLVWEPRIIVISVNGHTCLVNQSGDVAFQKPYIINLTMALGEGRDAPSALTPMDASMDVDYVRVWSWRPAQP